MTATTSQQERRRDPYPWTWEPAVGGGLGYLLLATLTAHLGRAIANLSAGGGWQFPARRDLFTSLPGLLQGDSRAGLPVIQTAAASDPTLVLWLVMTQLLLLATTLTLAVSAWRRWGSGRMRGMASRAEAERLLGRTRLRRDAPTIRPDLHPGTRRHHG